MLSVLLGILKAVALFLYHAIVLIAKIVYGILKFLHIRLLALYVAVCALLSLFFPVSTTGLVYFLVGLGVCVVVTLIGWILAVRRRAEAKKRAEALKREKREKRMRRKRKEEEAPSGEETLTDEAAPAAAPPTIPPPPRYPLYFEVEGHPGYFFAEYADRYELYRRTEGGGTEYIRTDFK